MSLVVRLWTFVLVVVFFLPAVSLAETSAGSAGVARVGNLVITQEDVERRTQKLVPMQLGFHGSMDEEKIARVKQNALDELVERAYKIQYAIAEEISVDGASFEREWQKAVSKNPGLKDPAVAHQASKLRADMYLDFLASHAESIAVDDKVQLTEDEVGAHYEENKKLYFRPKLYTVSHVFVKVDPASNAEEKKEKLERAEALYKRAIDGEDFYNLAYYESDDRSKYVGGSLGSFHGGQTVSEFDKVIKEMQPGEITGPVKTRFGFHVVKLDDISEERQLEFDEVASKIRTTLKSKKRSLLYDEWMSGLQERYLFERLN